MVFCFTCDVKLYGERTRVSSSISPHSDTPYPEKLAEILGEEFLIIVTPADHMCKKCSSLLTHVDKLEQDLKAVRNAIVTLIQRKYGFIPADQPIKTFDIVNGNLKIDYVESNQTKVSSGLTVKHPSVKSPLKMTKQPETSSKMKIYKCGFCAFQSKELGHVRFHMRSHMNQKGGGEMTAQTGTKLLTQASSQQQKQQQKKRLYKCQVCSLSFESRQICLDHIKKSHNRQTVMNNKQSKEYTPLETAEDNQQTGESAMVIGDDQQSNSAIDTDTDILNDDIPAEGSQQETQNTEGHVSTQVDAIKINPGTNIENIAEGEIAIGSEDNKSGGLDIESMLASIHHTTPPNDVDVVDNMVELL